MNLVTENFQEVLIKVNHPTEDMLWGIERNAAVLCVHEGQVFDHIYCGTFPDLTHCWGRELQEKLNEINKL